MYSVHTAWITFKHIQFYPTAPTLRNHNYLQKAMTTADNGKIYYTDRVKSSKTTIFR